LTYEIQVEIIVKSVQETERELQNEDEVPFYGEMIGKETTSVLGTAS